MGRRGQFIILKPRCGAASRRAWSGASWATGPCPEKCPTVPRRSRLSP